ncbi:hypothetical protein ASPZODRAFT_17485 [Penicilliopsis zonata CBS 506.65]|uniref:Rhodopsin domain-containing protein n=1 Tax=Penicilliopsis zonata CBS 506.65 TaxID=1073090 RepID=A0A1L9SDG8_9EURO|nr:hypothetical protein ASPZODRAFT_17485 [Penicilliopsis zonata CBS 506.65]OJJ45265.1 hypothetical protein ASPZODRAFT_17485 [Penicilliopsis zonata CBS 506.65]
MSDYRRNLTIIVTAVMLVVSTAVYGLRLLARRMLKKPLRIDDYCMGVGVFMSYVIAVCNFVAAANGLGEHEDTLSAKQRTNVLIATFILEKVWSFALMFVKSSIILFYLHIFRGPRFSVACYVLLAFTVCWMLAAFLGNTFQCTPVRYFYDKSIVGSCMNPRPFFQAIGSISVVEDVAILCLPMPILWQLQIEPRKKAILIFIFSLGGFVCVASIMRLITFNEIRDDDLTYTNVDSGLWTYIELAAGSICCSLALLRPLFGRLLNIGRGSQSHTYREHGRNTTPDLYAKAWPARTVNTAASVEPNNDAVQLGGFIRIKTDIRLDVEQSPVSI